MWVEPDLNMPDGESLVRQLLVGKRWYKQAYGVDVRIGWNPDSFGYTWQLPQIYKKSGVDYFVTQKMTWNDTNNCRSSCSGGSRRMGRRCWRIFRTTTRMTI
jgi:alpha-mannosidase